MTKTKKKLYIVPGFGESTRMKNYREVIKIGKENDFEIKPIKIIWDMDKNMDDYIKEVESQIPEMSKEDTILGFSFGAYIAYLLSNKKEFNNYIFCTISPYFKDNLKDIPQESKDYFGKNFINSLRKNNIHNGNKSNAWFLTGDKDWDLAIKTNKQASNKWSGNSNFILVKNCGHDLANLNYIKEVKKIIFSNI